MSLRGVECRVLPLSELLREEMPSRERVALLKVDVEGDELEVFCGGSVVVLTGGGSRAWW